MKLEEMKRNELLDFFITKIAGHEKEVEIAYILALFTAYNLPSGSASKYEVTELTTGELIDLIETGILNQSGAGFDEEEKVWDIILDTLKPEKVFDIITDIDRYMEIYDNIMQPIDRLEYAMLKIFVESEVR
jgi:hypothetical protein